MNREESDEPVTHTEPMKQRMKDWERGRDHLSTASQTDSSDWLVGNAHYPPFRELMKDLCKMQ